MYFLRPGYVLLLVVAAAAAAAAAAAVDLTGWCDFDVDLDLGAGAVASMEVGGVNTMSRDNNN